MTSLRTFDCKNFSCHSDLVIQKKQRGLTVSIVIPTLNEAKTIGSILKHLVDYWVEKYAVVDQIIVIDSGSTDETTAIANNWGKVEVYQAANILPEYGHYQGKGESLWKSLSVVNTDIVAFIDGDIKHMQAEFIAGLLAPLLYEKSILYNKAFYQRSLYHNDVLLDPEGGGRVTELLARPMINIFYPQLIPFNQPLSGEYAGHVDLFKSIPFAKHYGVEILHLIYLTDSKYTHNLAQTNLHQRIHRNHSLSNLKRVSQGVLETFVSQLVRQKKLIASSLDKQYLNMINQDVRQPWYNVVR